MRLIERCGIANVELFELGSIAERGELIADMVIINTSYFGTLTTSHLREQIGFGELKVVALQTTLVEDSQLHGFDDVVSIHDTEEVIKNKLLSLLERQDIKSDKKELSQREREIIVCVVKGMTNRQIADSLYISTHTVIAHRRNIASKLQIHSSAGLTIYAIVNKLVNLSEINV